LPVALRLFGSPSPLASTPAQTDSSPAYDRRPWSLRVHPAFSHPRTTVACGGISHQRIDRGIVFHDGFGTNSSATSPKIGRIRISDARRSPLLPPRWLASHTRSLKAVPITGPSSKGRFQVEESLSAGREGAQEVTPVDNARVFHLDQKLVLRTVRAMTTPMDPVFAMDETFSSSGSRLDQLRNALELTTITPRAHVRGQRSFDRQSDLLPLLGRCH